MKPVLPQVGPHHSAALAFLNRREDGTPTRVSAVLSDLGLISLSGYQVQELFDGNNLGLHLAGDTLSFNVNPSGIILARTRNCFFKCCIYSFVLCFTGVVMVKCTVQKKKKHLLTNKFPSLKDNSLF